MTKSPVFFNVEPPPVYLCDMQNKKNDLGKKSLALHKKHGGKLSVVSKVKLRTKEDWSICYTPGVAAVALHLGAHPNDAHTYSIKKNTIAIVSDGTAVLGLGNIGPLGALPVMEGKAAILKTLANVDAFPIVLDTTDPEKIIETVAHIAPGFGGINLEDIAAPNCFYIEESLKKKLSIPVMHDDQHGTAIVALAAAINALRVVKKKKNSVAVTIVGAGAAGHAIAHLFHRDGFTDILVVDREGAIGSHRQHLSKAKASLVPFTKRKNARSLEDSVSGADLLIGVSGPNLFTKEMVTTMAKNPIVFALANPTPEIMPDIAKKAGAAVVATGRSDFPNQVNNALAFPGIFRGALDHRVTEITDAMKLKAAYAIAKLVKKPSPENIIPSVRDPKVVPAVAKVIR